MIGMTFGESEASTQTVCALVVAFLGGVALWWTYFDRTEGLPREVITSSANPGLTALSAYTYSDVPMIAGIVAVAAADFSEVREFSRRSLPHRSARRTPTPATENEPPAWQGCSPCGFSQSSVLSVAYLLFPRCPSLLLVPARPLSL